MESAGTAVSGVTHWKANTQPKALSAIHSEARARILRREDRRANRMHGDKAKAHAGGPRQAIGPGCNSRELCNAFKQRPTGQSTGVSFIMLTVA